MTTYYARGTFIFTYALKSLPRTVDFQSWRTSTYFMNEDMKPREIVHSARSCEFESNGMHVGKLNLCAPVLCPLCHARLVQFGCLLPVKAQLRNDSACLSLGRCRPESLFHSIALGSRGGQQAPRTKPRPLLNNDRLSHAAC